jgi:hypothetical protein
MPQRVELDERDVKWVDVREPQNGSRGAFPARSWCRQQPSVSPRILQDDQVVFTAPRIRSAVACEVAAAVGCRIHNLEGGIRVGGPGFPDREVIRAIESRRAQERRRMRRIVVPEEHEASWPAAPIRCVCRKRLRFTARCGRNDSTRKEGADGILGLAIGSLAIIGYLVSDT